MKSIQDAVKDGTLIDVTDAAKMAYIRCPTFISAALWNGYLKRSDEELYRMLLGVSCMYDSCFGYDHIGPIPQGSVTTRLDICDEIGLVLVVTDSQAENSLGIKLTSGDEVEFFA